MKYQAIKYLTILLVSVVLLSSCSKDEKKNIAEGSAAAVTATFEFSDGKIVDFEYTPKKEDFIKPAINGPNENDHYKLWLRGEKTLGNTVYTLNLYVTMPEEGVGDYPFGRAWQWHDEGFVTEIHVGVQDKNNPLDLKTYLSTDIDNKGSKGVTVNSLTNNHIKGTFSGKAARTESDFVSLINGKFDVSIQRGTWEE